MFTYVSSACNDNHIISYQQHNMTAVHHACKFGHTEVVKLLLERSCDVMVRDNVSDDVICACKLYMMRMMRTYVPVIQNLISLQYHHLLML